MRNIKITPSHTFKYECEQPAHPASHRRHTVGTRSDDEARGGRTFTGLSRSAPSPKSSITIGSTVQEPTSNMCGDSEGGDCCGDNRSSHDVRNRHQSNTGGGRPNAHATRQRNDTEATRGRGEVRWVRAHQVNAERRTAVPPLSSTVRFIGSTLTLHLEGE